MIAYFPEPYPDETIYSIIGRYIRAIGDPSTRSIAQQLFQSQLGFSVHFQNNLDYLCNQLPNECNYTSEYFIIRHSILQFYKPFLFKDRWSEIIKNVKDNDGDGIRKVFYLTNGSKNSRLKGLCICPQCLEEDMETYGETYFHRNHQIQNNYVCHKHKQWLYEISPTLILREGRVIFPDDSVFQRTRIGDDISLEYYSNLANDIATFLNGNINDLNMEVVRERYIAELSRKNFMKNGEIINHKKVFDSFMSNYSEEYFGRLGLQITSQWFSLSFLNIKRATHPITHILFIKFLFGSVEEFLNADHKKFYAFGPGPFLCLNPVAEHYQEKTITSCKTKILGGEYVGYFKCDNCGFEYLRRGADESGQRVNEIYKIVKHGELWDSKLRSYLLMKKYSMSQIAKMMGTCNSTIYRLANNIRLNPDGNFHSSMQGANENSTKTIKEIEKKELYINDILELQRNNPGICRSQIIETLKRQYVWLYRNHNDELKRILPPKKPYSERNKTNYRCANWEKRDEEYSTLVKEAINEIFASQKPTRVTLAEIERNINTRICVFLNRMPLTKSVISKNLESLEQYKMRVDKYKTVKTIE